MSSVSHLIGGGFAHMDAPFGVHPRDRERAVAYRKAAAAAGVSWAEAEQDVRDYAAARGWTAEATEAQVKRAEKLLKRWLS